MADTPSTRDAQTECTMLDRMLLHLDEFFTHYWEMFEVLPAAAAGGQRRGWVQAGEGVHGAQSGTTSHRASNPQHT
ncbi:Hypothetical predicted protein [Pelobates cultripes]|uniref:Uncharacterized protein n=1 Tax=Pelobates cultripes TaxID=61616 RepID=A0AAD1WWU4_PELCU|nr:Hypothetical predicted protein [Pelobates cultripes]